MYISKNLEKNIVACALGAHPMMNTPGMAVNLAGKSYLISKNLEQGALMNIINKLQTDLVQMKYMSHKQSESQQMISSDTHLKCANSDQDHSICSGTSSFTSPQSLELKSRLKKNYEEKVHNLIELYEKKLTEYKEKLRFLEDDREAFVEALELKHTTITKMKNQLRDLEVEKARDLEEMRKAHADELKQLQNELHISDTCYKDLEQVRRYLEKNNTAMKTEIADTQAKCEQKILRIADEYETEKCKYKNELKQIKKSIEEVEKQAETKVEELRQSLQVTSGDYETQVNQLKEEIAHLKQQQKVDEEERQKLEVEQRSYEDKLKHTKMYYEAKINSLNVNAWQEREHYMEDVEAIKTRLEGQFVRLEADYVSLERDVEMKKKEFMECETVKKQLSLDLASLRTEFDLTTQKYAGENDHLKESLECAKQCYEMENSKLKMLLLDKEKIADDLDITVKKYEKQYTSLKNTIKEMKEEAEQDNAMMWDKLKNEKSFYQEEINKLKADYSFRSKKQEDELCRIREENNGLMENIEKVESLKRTLEKSNRDLKTNLDNAFEKYKDDMDQAHRDLNAKCAEYETQIEELQSEIEKHRKTIQQNEDQNQMLQATMEEYKIVNAESSAKHVSEIGHLRNELAMTKRFHTDDLISIQKQLELKEQIEKEKDERILKLKEHIAEIKSSQTTEIEEKLDKLEKQRKELDIDNTVLKHQLNDLTDELKLQKDTFETMQERQKKRHDDEKEKLRNDNDNMTKAIDILEKTVTDQERENKLLRKNLEDISKVQSDETFELAAKLSLARQKYDEKVHKLKQELESSRRNYEDDLEKSRNEFHINRQQYEEEIQELKIECNSRKQLYQELEAAKKKLEENMKMVQSDDFQKLALLGAMGQMKLTED